MHTPWNPLIWASEHWTQLVMILALCTFLYRLYIAIEKFLMYPGAIISTEKNMNLMMTNHLPHLQIELESMNEHLRGIRDDFKEQRADFRALLVRGRDA